MKTIFITHGMTLRISKECGVDRFTKEEIENAINGGLSKISGCRNHCLCRRSDGKVFAEIINFL